MQKRILPLSLWTCFYLLFTHSAFAAEEFVASASNDASICHGSALIRERKLFTCVLVQKKNSQTVLTLIPRGKTTAEALKIILSDKLVVDKDYKVDAGSSFDYENKASFQFISNGSSQSLGAEFSIYQLPSGNTNEIAMKFYAYDASKKSVYNGILYAVLGAKSNVFELKLIPSDVLAVFRRLFNDRSSLAEGEIRLKAMIEIPTGKKAAIPAAGQTITICVPSKVSTKMYTKTISVDNWDLYSNTSYIGQCRVDLRPNPYFFVE